MNLSDNALNVLTTCEYNGIGKGWVNKNLHGVETVPQIVAMISKIDYSVTIADFESRKAQIRSEIELLGDAIDGVVGIGDKEFPEIQSGVKVSDCPIALFYKGDISLIKFSSRNVAIIGLLTPSEQIEEDEREIVRKLVKQGRCIVSGLARGCDTIAHRETLECKGKTVAFLSSPLSEINPPSNKSLSDEIVAKGGLLVSEYFKSAISKREFIGRYAERDRLQAMFSEAVILAASYSQKDCGKDSGSRFAMDRAKEYGIPRYVIYRVDRDSENPMFNLAREEITKGAKILTPESDIFIDSVAQGTQLYFDM